MTKWYEQAVPTRQEAAAAAGDQGRYRSRKDRHRWCGGRTGREHVTTIAIPPNQAGWKPCHAAPDWYWQTRWGQKQRKGWWCRHEPICTVCGKQFGPIPWWECPDRPDTGSLQQ